MANSISNSAIFFFFFITFRKLLSHFFHFIVQIKFKSLSAICVRVCICLHVMLVYKCVGLFCICMFMSVHKSALLFFTEGTHM